MLKAQGRTVSGKGSGSEASVSRDAGTGVCGKHKNDVMLTAVCKRDLELNELHQILY